MSMRLWSGLAAICCAVGMAGCACPKSRGSRAFMHSGKREVDLIRTTYCAVDAMLRRARRELTSDKRILVATFVDLDNLDRTDAFGRLSGEMAAGRLVQRGYAAINLNVRHRSVAIIQRHGQVILSRDIKELGDKHAAELTLVGTYTIAPKTVYASIKLVHIADGTLIGAIDYAVPVCENLTAMLSRTTSAGEDLADRQLFDTAREDVKQQAKEKDAVLEDKIRSVAPEEFRKRLLGM